MTDTGQDGSFYLGEDIVLAVTVTIDGDLSTMTLRARLKSQTSGETLYTYTTGAGITAVNSPAKVATIVIPKAHTETLKPGGHHWDLWRVDSGSAAALSIGQFDVQAAP